MMPIPMKRIVPNVANLKELFARHVISLATEHAASLLGYEHGSIAYALLTAQCQEALTDSLSEERGMTSHEEGIS